MTPVFAHGVVGPKRVDGGGANTYVWGRGQSAVGFRPEPREEEADLKAKARCRRSGSGVWTWCLAILPVAAAGPAEPVAAQSLRGGLASMQEQNRRAIEYDYSFTEDPAHVRRLVDLGLLVPLRGNENYVLDDEVSFGYARKEVRTFVERLSRQYRSACGEVLVVTSLTRPKSRQPRNSSRLSVHPTGMAVDLRRSNHRPCRAWLDDVLLHLEAQGTVQATYERYPPHYHIAVYTHEYVRYVERLEQESRQARDSRAPVADAGPMPSVVRYEVRSGDSLWTIAQAYGTTVDRLRSANKLRGSRIYAGQTLEVPVGSR